MNEDQLADASKSAASGRVIHLLSIYLHDTLSQAVYLSLMILSVDDGDERGPHCTCT